MNPRVRFTAYTTTSVNKLRYMHSTQRPDDMALTATVTRVSKHRYVADVYAKKTSRIIDIELLTAPSKREAFAQLKRMYPSIQRKKR